MKLHLPALVFCFLLVTSGIFAQTTTTPTPPPAPQQPAFGITWGGFAKLDWGIDTRATTNLREGDFSLYPVAASFDANKKDVNATPQSMMLAVQTRLNAKITGPDFMGGKTTGYIEGEFFGTSETDVNGFRLRHAWMKTTWSKSELMLGQGWHPMFVPECFPGVYNFNTGVPFQPFNRSPQIRYTLMPSSKLKIFVAALGERDFQSIGPDVTTPQGTQYQRLAVVPNLHGQIQFNSGKVLAGAGFDFKSLRPRIKTLKGYSTDTKVNSTALIGYFKYTASPAFFLKVEGTYGSNMTDQTMLGGYAEVTVDSTRGYTYDPTKVFAGWLEIGGTSGKVEYGLFAGYTNQLGTADNITGATWGRGIGKTTTGAIDNVFRVAPRIGLKEGKMTIGLELEYTAAQYGSAVSTDKLKVKTTDASNVKIDAVSNIRVMLTGIYAF
jgi:hypothetical protein